MPLRERTLVVAVADPAWATQLRFLEQELLARIAAATGSDEVTAIEVRVRRPRVGRPELGLIAADFGRSGGVGRLASVETPRGWSEVSHPSGRLTRS